jgi:hypothetical protein
MDQRILDKLRHAPSLDLYEPSLTVDRLLADPVRILEIRKLLHLGARVKFFHHQTNALAAGIVVELRQKEVPVQLEGTRSQWWLPYTAITVEPAQRAPESVFGPAAPVEDAIDFRVGGTVGFTDKYFRERVGTVIRINDKSISIDCDGES